MSADGFLSAQKLGLLHAKLHETSLKILNACVIYFEPTCSRNTRGKYNIEIRLLLKHYNEYCDEYYKAFNEYLLVNQPVLSEELFDFAFLDDSAQLQSTEREENPFHQ